jgi:hypothetical protein
LTVMRRLTRILSLPHDGLGAHGARLRAGAPAMRFVHGGVERERRGAWGPRKRPSRGPGQSPGLFK